MLKGSNGRLTDDLSDGFTLEKLRLELVMQMIFVKVLFRGDIGFLEKVGIVQQLNCLGVRQIHFGPDTLGFAYG